MSYIYNPQMYAAERELAMYIKRLVKKSCQRIDTHYGDLDDKQPQAVDMACTRSLSLLSGLPGTGKTKTLAQIIQSYDKQGMTGVVMGPTGQAQKRAKVTIDEIDAVCKLRNKPKCSTIHAGLQFDPRCGRFAYSHENPLPYDYVVMDEGSMPDCMMSRSFYAAIDPDTTRVVMSGDPNQIPSVEPGSVMSDMIASKIVPATNLTKIFRQGANSGIAHNAKQILSGQSLLTHDPVTKEKFDDFFFVPKEQDDAPGTILSYVSEKIPLKRGFDPVKDIQVLAPGKKGNIGTVDLNNLLRERLNPKIAGSISFHGFRAGDKVINRKNYLPLNLVNGDVGYVKMTGASGMTVDFGEGCGQDERGVVEVSEAMIAKVFHAYCSTVHSFQGCEVKVVIMPLYMAHYMLLFRNLLYTGVTRARLLTVLIGDPNARDRCIKNDMVDRRVTGLQTWLAA